jgi:hypothetical protein
MELVCGFPVFMYTASFSKRVYRESEETCVTGTGFPAQKTLISW